MRLFQRKAILTVETVPSAEAPVAPAGTKLALQFICGRNNFDLTFDVKKDLSSKPNRATIQIYNLTADHRAQLTAKAAQGPARVTLEAGYEEGTSRIFAGDFSILYHDRRGADFVTYIETGDGDRITGTNKIFKSWGPGTSVTQVIKDIAAELDLGDGNVLATATGALLEGWGPVFSQGTAVAGSTFDALTRICRSAGLEWSIQDGTLQFLVQDKALAGLAVLVTPSTGMDGTIKIDHKGRLHVKTRIVPNVFPGRKIQLEDKSVWRVDRATFKGQTRGNSWDIDLECKPA